MAGQPRMASRAFRAERHFRCGAAGAATVTPANSEQHFASLALKENGAGETLVANSGVPPKSSAVLRIGSREGLVRCQTLLCRSGLVSIGLDPQR
jgi:hypothetical protein